MKPIVFAGQNVVFGENQPDYQPLPALRMPDGEVITCWRFSDEEFDTMAKNRCFYLSQLTFNGALQPIMPMAELGDNLSME